MDDKQRKRIRKRAREFADVIAEISSSTDDWRAFYEEFAIAICRCAKALKRKKHPGRAGRLVLLGRTFEVLSLSVRHPTDVSPSK
jgi:hypothetical protein